MRRIACSIALILFALTLPAAARTHAAMPSPFSWGSFSPTGATTYGVYDTDNATILQTGDTAQLLWVGPNGAIDPPLNATGAAGGDDRVLDTNAVQNGG